MRTWCTNIFAKINPGFALSGLHQGGDLYRSSRALRQFSVDPSFGPLRAYTMGLTSKLLFQSSGTILTVRRLDSYKKLDKI